MLMYRDAKTNEVLVVLSTETKKGNTLYHYFKDDGTIGVKNQNEVLLVRYYRKEIYCEAWKYAVQYCRKYGICTSTKKWLPWEKKFFWCIYNAKLNRGSK